MIDKDKYIFLLGGHDLEMSEIRNILDLYGLRYHDLNLEWGAKLSAYRGFMDNEHTFAGVELIGDIEPPPNYIEIDHHNEKSDLPSSIEQVAALLGISLDRRQLLVAANDRGYIPAMLVMGASDNEVKEIREADRRAQGVTEENERLAGVAIKKSIDYGDLLVVYYDGDRFSPVTDRVTAKQMIVWNHKTLTYYGHKAGLLEEYFKYLISEGKAYCGGKPLSFFGLAKNCCNKTEIEKIKEVLIQIVKNQ